MAIQVFLYILFGGDKLREKMEEGKRDETFFSALLFAQTYTNCVLKKFRKLKVPFQN